MANLELEVGCAEEHLDKVSCCSDPWRKIPPYPRFQVTVGSGLSKTEEERRIDLLGALLHNKSWYIFSAACVWAEEVGQG